MAVQPFIPAEAWHVLRVRIGRAEPDDVQGWLEHGGALALQRALALPPAALRVAIEESGVALSVLQADQPVHVALTMSPTDNVVRMLVEELPAWILEGTVLLALACEQREATLHLSGGTPAHLRLLRDVGVALERLGFVGLRGWAGGVHLACKAGPAPAHAFAGEAVALLGVALWHWDRP